MAPDDSYLVVLPWSVDTGRVFSAVFRYFQQYLVLKRHYSS